MEFSFGYLKTKNQNTENIENIHLEGKKAGLFGFYC